MNGSSDDVAVPPPRTTSLPFPLADLSKDAPPESSMLLTDLDITEMVAPLLAKLPIFHIKPGLKINDSEGLHLRPSGQVNRFIVGHQMTQVVKPGPSRKAMRQKERKTKQLLKKIASGEKHAATYVATPASFEDFPTTGTGWAGRDVRFKTNQQWLQQAWLDQSLLKSMVDRGFKFVSFDGFPTWLVDKNGVVFGYRTDIPKWMQEIVVLDGHNISLLGKIAAECKGYMQACGDISQSASEKNWRGPHWAHVSGVDRQISSEPKYTSFHLKHLELTNALMEDKESALRRLVQHASRIFEVVFPSLADRVLNCRDALLAMGVPPEIATPQYGYWYNFCINGSRGSTKGVYTRPHADAKNLAIMMCGVFVYGTFDSKEKAWLVLWEAGLIIEVPAGVLIFYPSALFTHFNINVNLADLQFVTTSDGSAPTPQTASPLNGVDGRGSIVLFNQASLFQYAELGCTVAEAQKKGACTSCDNAEHIQRLPVTEMY